MEKGGYRELSAPVIVKLAAEYIDSVVVSISGQNFNLRSRSVLRSCLGYAI